MQLAIVPAAFAGGCSPAAQRRYARVHSVDRAGNLEKRLKATEQVIALRKEKRASNRPSCTMHQQHGLLTPDERFRLLLVGTRRSDDQEYERLNRSVDRAVFRLARSAK